MNKSEKSEINKAAYQVGVLVADLVRTEAMFLKQQGKELKLKIDVDLVWNEELKQFDFVEPDSDKF